MLQSLSLSPAKIVPCFLGRDNSFGRKRRDTDNDNETEDRDRRDAAEEVGGGTGSNNSNSNSMDRDRRDAAEEVGGGTGDGRGGNKVEIKEMFRVYESREIIPQESAQNRVNNTFKDILGRGGE